MGVAGTCEVFAGGSELDGGDDFGDEVSGAGPDNVDTEEAIGFGVGEDFDFAVDLAESAGASDAAEVEDALVVVGVFVFELLFGLPDGGDFGLGVYDAWDSVVVDVSVSGDDLFDTGDGFFGGFVGEHGTWDDVSDGVDAAGCSPIMVIDLDAAFFVELHADVFEAEIGCIWFSADGEQDTVGGDGFLVVAVYGALSVFDVDCSDLGLEFELESLAFEEFLRFLCDFEVHTWEDSIEVFEDGDVCAEAAPDGSEFEADVAGAYDDEVFGDVVVAEGFGGGCDVFSVGLDTGEVGGAAAGGDDDIVGLQHVFFVAVFDGDLVGFGEAGMAVVAVDLVLFEEGVDAFGEGFDDFVFVFEHFGEVEFDVFDLDAEAGEVFAGFDVFFAGFEERLAGDAADAQAGSTEGGFLLDAGDVEAELCGANGGDVAGWAGADNDEVVFGHGV